MNYLNRGFLAALLICAGCDGGDTDTDAGMTGDTDAGMTGDTDAGMTGEDDAGMTETDAGMTDAGGGEGSGDSCEDPRVIALADGEQTITGDTTGRSSSETLNECGGDAAPQEILALTIPGTGDHRIDFTLETDGTSTELDTVVEVRLTGDCATSAGSLCFDDTDESTLSAGTFFAQGGDTVHLIVSGFDADSAGPWEMDVTVSAATIPVLTSGVASRFVDDDRIDITVDGTDAGGDAAFLAFTFLDDTGAEVFTDVFEFSDNVAGQNTFTALTRLDGISAVEEIVTAPTVRVAIVDAEGAASATMDLTITNATLAQRGDACDATNICAESFECSAGSTCEIPATTTTSCAAATATPLTPAIDGTLLSVDGTIAPGEGIVYASCGNTRGNEALYGVVVPAGTFDLVATTDTVDTGEADTVLYLQATCNDPGSEPADGCNDDIDFPSNPRSTIEVLDIAAGTYVIGVEAYRGEITPVPFQLDLRLRPVIGAGAACDPAEVENRCSTGACPTGTDPVCPTPTL